MTALLCILSFLLGGLVIAHQSKQWVKELVEAKRDIDDLIEHNHALAEALLNVHRHEEFNVLTVSKHPERN